MSAKSPIPQHTLTTQATKGVFIIDLSQYDHYKKHTVAEPHRDDHFTIVVLLSGQIELMIDFGVISISKPAFLLIAPEQVHQLIKMGGKKGWLINIDASALTNELQNDIRHYLDGPLLLDTGSAITTNLLSLLAVATGLGTTTGNTFVDKVIYSTIESVVNLAISLTASTSASRENSGRAALIYREFTALLNLHFKIWKQPSDYAAAMRISPSHLNDTVKLVSGTPVSLHIQSRNILEAKRLLYNTNRTASEIAFELGYEDPVYFGKLFKKHTQLTPLAFRAKFRD